MNLRKPRMQNLNPGSTDPGNQVEEEIWFDCEFPGCARKFKSKKGRGVHYNAAHKDWYEGQKIGTLGPKQRWTEEERKLLARKEAEILVEAENRGESVNINQALDPFFPERTLESIKGARRRADHKGWVIEIMQELRQQDHVSVNPSSDEQEVQVDGDQEQSNNIRSYVAALEAVNMQGFRAHILNDICSEIMDIEKEALKERIASYILDVFPVKRRGSKKVRHGEGDVNVSNKRKRRRLYARCQQLWAKDRGRCWKAIDSDQVDGETTFMPRDAVEPFWRAVVTRRTDAVPELRENLEIADALWAPISEDEVKKCYPANTSSPGPDGLSVGKLKEIPLEILHRIFNIFMICECLPQHLMESRTVFIPKKKDCTEPGHLRPLTITPVLIRAFHKILACRLRSVRIDDRQRAFRDTDGCSDNICLLDLALRFTRRHIGQLFMASTDVAKAFDSVSFKALERVMRAKGLPPQMILYIMSVYERSVTRFDYGGWTSDPIHPTCGVKQGDPLSPVLFNFIIDEMIKNMPSDIGVKISNMSLSVLAFADDLILMATTSVGLQRLLDSVGSFLNSVGLNINAQKSCSISIRSLGKQKKTAVDASCIFRINNQEIPALKRSDELKYLGVPFTPEGHMMTNVRELLKAKLIKLGSAPLKPQQRLWILRVCIIPSLYYHLTTGSIKVGLLRSIDRDIRAIVRKWLRLPSDCPNAYFHAHKLDGGLDIPSVRYRAPLLRRARVRRLLNSEYVVGDIADLFLQKEENICDKRLRCGEYVLDNQEDLRKMWFEKLLSSVDGRALGNSYKVKNQHDWVTDASKFISGRDFINSCRLRINSMPTRARTSRGRAKDLSCRAGCGCVETQNHILQQCHRTHDTRIKRHDSVAQYVGKKLQENNYIVEREPKIRTPQGLRKPDIVASRNGISFVLDAQIISDKYDQDSADSEKIAKYASDKDLLQSIRARYQTTTIKVFGITLNNRGVWSSQSANNLVANGIIKRDDLKIISSRTIIGGILSFSRFNERTYVRPSVATTSAAERAGVG